MSAIIGRHAFTLFLKMTLTSQVRRFRRFEVYKSKGVPVIAVSDPYCINLAVAPLCWLSLMLIGYAGKELFCVKKSILVTFSVLIISLCEVKTTLFYAVFLPN